MPFLPLTRLGCTGTLPSGCTPPLGPCGRDPHARLLSLSPVVLEARGPTLTICLAAEPHVLQEAHAVSCWPPVGRPGTQPAALLGWTVLFPVGCSQGLGPSRKFHLHGASGGEEVSSGERIQLVQTLQCSVWSAVRVLLQTLSRDVCGVSPVRENGEAGSPCADAQWRHLVPRACPAGLHSVACVFNHRCI